MDLRRSFAEIILGCKVESVPALAVDLRQVSGGDEPGVVRAGSLCVHPVTFPRLVPEDEARTGVTDALRGALLLVVLEEEGGRTWTL